MVYEVISTEDIFSERMCGGIVLQKNEKDDEEEGVDKKLVLKISLAECV